MPLNRPFEWAGRVSFAAAGLLLIAGLWTFTFQAVEGELEFAEYRSQVPAVGALWPVRGRIRGASDVTMNQVGRYLDVSYRYRVDDEPRYASRIGMGVTTWTMWPFGRMPWQQRMDRGQSLRVYYSQQLPSVAVLHRGFDVLLVSGLTLVGWGLRRFSRWLRTPLRTAQS